MPNRTYGWSGTVYEEVPDSGTFVVQAPGLTDVIDPASAEVAVDSAVYDGTKAPTAFDTGAQTITVTNATGAPWAPNAIVYVGANGKGVSGGGDAIADLEARLAAIETDVATQAGEIDALDARVTALEAPV